MRLAIVTGLVAVGLVTVVGGVLAAPLPVTPPKLQPVQPVVQRKLSLNPATVAALQAQKPLAMQDKLRLLAQGKTLTVQPIPEGPFTLTVQNNMVVAPNGAVIGTLSFSNAPLVLASGVGSYPFSFASLSSNPQSAAIVDFQTSADKLYLVDCGSAEADTITFAVSASGVSLGSSTVTPQAGHSTFVVQRQGSVKDIEIVVTGGGSHTQWSFGNCEVTPFH